MIKLAACAFMGAVFGAAWAFYADVKIENHNTIVNTASAYRILHSCERRGFAGKDAEPYYQCDTGLLTQTEMYHAAKEGN